MLFRACVFCLSFYAARLWDSHPKGRVGKSIDKSLDRQRPFLTNYFQTLQPIKCMVAEILQVHHTIQDPAIFLSHYMDNNYICLFNVLEDLRSAVRELGRCSLAQIYCIPIKLEPGGPCVTWCEGSRSTAGSLVMKGVPHKPLSPTNICTMWTHWPDPWSPNCPLVLQSMLPSLVNKALVLCSAAFFRIQNLQAIIQGCHFKSYPWSGWWLTMRVRLRNVSLLSEVPLHRVRTWYNEGKQKGRLGVKRTL